jgi:acetyl-CoA acetyltransferase
VDPKTGDEKTVTISVDDGIRPNATLSDLSKLKPVFKKDGTTTAGIRPYKCDSFLNFFLVIIILFNHLI